jgi:hypothetical protein
MSYFFTRSKMRAATNRLQKLMVIAENADSREEAQAAIREADAIRYAMDRNVRPSR